jgi:hypothetical protein
VERRQASAPKGACHTVRCGGYGTASYRRSASFFFFRTRCSAGFRTRCSAELDRHGKAGHHRRSFSDADRGCGRKGGCAKSEMANGVFHSPFATRHQTKLGRKKTRRENGIIFLPLPACGERSARIADACRVRGRRRESEHRKHAPHPACISLARCFATLSPLSRGEGSGGEGQSNPKNRQKSSSGARGERKLLAGCPRSP